MYMIFVGFRNNRIFFNELVTLPIIRQKEAKAFTISISFLIKLTVQLPMHCEIY